MIGKIIQPELEAFIANRNFAGLQSVFKEMLVPDIAEVIRDILRTTAPFSSACFQADCDGDVCVPGRATQRRS